MSLPGDAAASTAVQAPLLSPDNRDRTDLLLDYELGGVALNDPSAGLQVQPWEAWSDGAHLWVAPSPGRTPTTLLLTGSGITEVALAFDQNMRATVAYVESGTAKLRWFDTSIGAMTTTSYAGATSPMLTLDDKRALSTLTGTSDVLFAYIRAGSVYYRQQRDRFTIERLLGALPPSSTRIDRIGMGANNRLQIWAGSFGGLGEAPPVHVGIKEDEAYLLDAAGDIRALHGGAPAEAVWHSRIFEMHEQPSMGWARVDAASYPVTLTVFADSDSTTQAMPSDEPVRLHDVRGRQWQVEIRSTSRVLSVRLASSREELEAEDGYDL